MLHYGRFRCSRRWSRSCPAWVARAQQQENDRPSEPRNAVSSKRTVEPSDLSKDNLLRVAASSAQIQSVLARDAGILVELKTWVAKEATDNGQVVDDSLLTDLAIFDRLDRDMEFRSVATRMVQRYGYLLPSVNPDSEIAKQQELVLKERAHIMAQRQDSEQAALLAAAESERKEQQEQARVERTACDPRNQSTCNGLGVAGRRGTAGSFQGDITIPDMTTPIMPDQLPPSSSQRDLRRSSADPSDSGGLSSVGSGLTLASDSTRYPGGASSGDAGAGSAAGMGLGGSRPGGMQMGGMDGLDGMLRRGNLDDLAGGNRPDTTTASLKDLNRTVRLPDSRGVWGSQRRTSRRSRWSTRSALTPISPRFTTCTCKLLRVTANRNASAWRCFRNGTRELDAIPMDLPVGPGLRSWTGRWSGDQLVGRRVAENDSIGGSRRADHSARGRAGAGKRAHSGRGPGIGAAGACATQFRDVSADVSLSRLRTIRVYVVGEVAEPGAYDISSLSTPLNALFAAGGITPRGSLRNLKHYRGKQLIEEVDAYDLLLHGVGSDLKRLENGDSLLVPPIGRTGHRRAEWCGVLRSTNCAEKVHWPTCWIWRVEYCRQRRLRHIEVQRLEAHEKRTMLTLGSFARRHTATA